MGNAKQKSELLKKYMQLVIAVESVSFISDANNHHISDAPTFTTEEIEQLQKIESEIIELLNK